MAKLVYVHGTMNSAKSARLIMEAYNLQQNGKKIAVFKPAVDTRDGGIVQSRAVPTTLKAILIDRDETGSMFKHVVNEQPRTVLIDEAQFLTTEQVLELVQIVDLLETTVICYGLLSDFKSELFEGSKALITFADIVERVHSECTECKNEGKINARFVNDDLQLEGDLIVTGAEEIYKVLCRKCYFNILHSI